MCARERDVVTKRVRRVLIIVATTAFLIYMTVVFAGLLVIIFTGGLNP